MKWLRRKAEREALRAKINYNERETERIRREKEEAIANTPMIRKDSEWLRARGKTNGYGESLMISYARKLREDGV